MITDELDGPELEAIDRAFGLHPFVIQIKRASEVRLEMEVRAVSRVAAQKSNEGLCRPGEQCVAYRPEEIECRKSGHLTGAAKQTVPAQPLEGTR